MEKKSLEHNGCLYATSLSEQSIRKPPTGNVPSPQNYFQANCWSVILMLLKKHWSNIGTIFLNVILLSWDLFLHIFFVSKSTMTKISLLVFFLVRKQSSEGALWRNYFRWPLRGCSSLATMLKICCCRCFSWNLVKIYRVAILMNFFQCMRSKSQWSTHPVVFFNPLMLVATKGHTYLNKPESLSWRLA